jgi:hypothetical protein
LKAVGKSLWNIELRAVLLREDGADPMKISGRTWPQIDRDIPYRASNTGDQFVLLVGRHLKMKTTQGVLGNRMRHAVLREIAHQSMCGKFLLAKSPCKAAAAIGHGHRFNDPQAVYLCLTKTHENPPP